LRAGWIIRKEFQEMRRDKVIVRAILLTPILQLVVQGYAANLEVRNVPVAVCDQDQSDQSRALLAEIAQQPYFVLAIATQRTEDLIAHLDARRALVALTIPPDFGRKLGRRTAELQLLVDGSDATSAGLAAAYLSGLLTEHGVKATRQRLARLRAADPRLPRVVPDIRVWYNPDLRSVYYYVPGVAALILLILTQILTALAIVRERELGTLEQLMVTPIRPWELIVGKMVPFALVGIVDFTLVVLVATLWFRVPLRGSIPFLYGAALLFLLPVLGLGLLVSTTSRTQQQAVLLNFFMTMPAVLLSGFIFPIANMPQWLQYMTYAVPLRYFLQILRGVFLKGAGPDVLWPQCLAMVGLGALFLTAGIVRFRKRL